ncbi:MAG: hypothetical protein ACRC2B_23990 [Rubrivivax sp.]
MLKGAVMRPMRTSLPLQPRATAPAQPVLQTLRAPQQLCLDLQPRLR